MLIPVGGSSSVCFLVFKSRIRGVKFTDFRSITKIDGWEIFVVVGGLMLHLYGARLFRSQS